MKIDAPVELVTLSDSLTSPLPKSKSKSQNAEKGTTKVVCLDSDTDSDGSYAHAFVSGLARRTSNTGNSGGSPDACKKQADSWLGLRKCAIYKKSWSPSHSLSFEKETEIDVQASFKAIVQVQHSHSALDSNADAVTKSKQDADIKSLLHCGDLHSHQIAPVQSFDCKPYVDHKALQPFKGAADVALHSSYSPCASYDQGFYVGNSYSYNNSMLSTSPCDEVKSTLVPLTDTQDVDAPENHGACLSSPSKELDDYPSRAWDDHLKGIISKLEPSKATESVNGSEKQALERGSKTEYGDHDDDKDSRGFLFLKRKPQKCGAGDTPDSGDSSSCKKMKKSPKGGSSGADSKPAGRTVGGATARTVGVSRTTIRNIDDSTKALDKEAEKLKKKEKQMRDREEREAKKQQLKEEREILRQEKQEEKKRQQELKKRRNEEEKKRKEDLKVEAVEKRNVEKEKEKWEKGKFALQNITALVDTQILEEGLIGGHLLTRFAEKGFKYHIVKNPVKKTVIWQMKLPSTESVLDLQEDCRSQDSQELKTSKKPGPHVLSLESVIMSYVLIVLEADEFLELITEGALVKHVRNLQKLYPGFTLCYLINRLMRYLHKREQQQYKKPGDNWIRPPVEQVLAKLVTSYDGVHSRLCMDEAEVSEHIVGLTRSLAECPFKRKLTPLSLSANGDHVVKNDPNNDVIKKDVWLKALVALPKVSGSCAIAIAKKYPSMSALFEAYLDPLKTVLEKEYLLQDLMKEGLLGGETNRRIGPVCSRLVYRILMAEQGNLRTDDVGEGADAFRD